MTVTYPLDGDVACSDRPPTHTWSPETCDRFRVFIGATPAFSDQVTSGDALLRTTSWTAPPRRWRKICLKASPNLYLRVMGKVHGTRRSELSGTNATAAK